jgi:hypothetical protein
MPTVKLFLRFGFASVRRTRLGHRRREILRRQAVAAADHARHRRALAARDRAGQRGDDILEQRLAGARRLPWSVRARRWRAPSRAARQQMRDRERTIQRTCSTPTFSPRARSAAAVSRAVSAPEPIRTITRSASARPHSRTGDRPAGQRGEALHRGSTMPAPGVERIDRLARLEERVRGSARCRG